MAKDDSSMGRAATSVKNAALENIQKYGFATVGCVVLSWAFYCFYLVPTAERDKTLIKTLTDSVDDNKDGVRAIVRSSAQQADSLDSLDDTMERAQRTDEAQQEMVEAFVEEVREQHPEQSAKLDRILEKLNGE